ncbi:MAG TPA: hypothetical protein VG166_02670 [Caulobacteraceae bacterium]|nr:hypothetical protein [Caulobacteraceae bacterium]
MKAGLAGVINRWVAAALASAMAASPCLAGPPYTTDDPEPTPAGHWEDRVFVSGLQTPGLTSGQAGFDINYGGAKDLQLTLLAPLDYASGTQDAFGLGNVQVSVKYRFLHQDEHGLTPDVAVFPALTLPTQARIFGPSRLGVFLPVWAQKDFGAWSTFGGAGYDINPGPGHRDFTLAGWALTRQVARRLNLGVEIYHQTPDTVGGRALTAVAGGVVFQLTPHFALMASGGPAVQGARDAGQAVFYAALQYTN